MYVYDSLRHLGLRPRLLTEGFLKVVELKPTLKRLIVLRFGVYLPEGVVAGDKQPFRAALYGSALGLCWELVVICPLLEMMPTDLVGA